MTAPAEDLVTAPDSIDLKPGTVWEDVPAAQPAPALARWYRQFWLSLDAREADRQRLAAENARLRDRIGRLAATLDQRAAGWDAEYDEPQAAECRAAAEAVRGLLEATDDRT